MPFPTRAVCLAAVAALSLLFIACGGVGSGKTFPEASEDLQARRKAALEEARQAGILGECDTFHNALRVKAPFYRLSRDDQVKLADVAFALCFRLPVDAPQEQLDRLEFRGLHLGILDDRTGQQVGLYNPAVGLRLD